MKKIVLSLLCFLMAGLAQSAPKKAPGMRVAKPSPEEKVYSATALSVPASSSMYKHEFTTTLTRGYFISGKECKDCSTGSIIDIGGSYLRYWKDDMQYGTEARLLNLSKEASVTGKSATRFDVLAIGAYNFSSDLKNSIYAKAGVGLYSVIKDDGSDYENKFGLFLGAGKRFAWLKEVILILQFKLIY